PCAVASIAIRLLELPGNDDDGRPGDHGARHPDVFHRADDGPRDPGTGDRHVRDRTLRPGGVHRLPGRESRFTASATSHETLWALSRRDRLPCRATAVPVVAGC